MHYRRLFVVVLMQLVLLAVSASLVCAGLITLEVNPKPPNAVFNDGTECACFTWSITFDTVCCSPYLFDILDPNGVPIADFVPPVEFPCGVSPLQNHYEWLVPEGQPCGGYQGRIRFFSDWQGPGTCTLEDEARVSFLVNAAARFKICKFLDVNHDGVKDPDEPLLPDWTFTIDDCQGRVLGTESTGPEGCAEFKVEVECEGTTDLCVTETLPPGWVKTTQNGANPFNVSLVPGANPDILVGNWQPIVICGNVLIDQAPWPWTDPHWVGPDGQENPVIWEPVPPCPQPIPPESCQSPFQPDQEFIPEVTVNLYDAGTGELLGSTTTDEQGAYCFGPLQWRQGFRIEVEDPAAVPPECDTVPDDCGLTPWAGDYNPTVATSPWPCRVTDFTTPKDLEITLPQPVVPNQAYGCNNFWFHQPSRLWGKFCDLATSLMPEITVGVVKDGKPYIPDTAIVQPDGCYEIIPLPQEPEGLRPGTYRLTPPPVPDPATMHWEVTVYCGEGGPTQTFPLPAAGYVDVEVGHSADVRVDFCIKEENGGKRRCYMPVTFSQAGWAFFCDPENPIIPGGMIYNKFRIAFANFNYYGAAYPNRVIIGYGNTITYEGTTAGLLRMCMFLPQDGPCGKLFRSYVNPWAPTNAGQLAGETLALMLNIAYNDMRLMPRTAGYDLERFKLSTGPLKGKTVGQVLDIANQVLGGRPPCMFGLPDCDTLVEILASINGNYEFFDFDTYIDNGYLIPNRGFGPSDPPHSPQVPYVP